MTQARNSKITLRFTGVSARGGPLTLGQADMLAWILGETEQTNVFARWDIPRGTGLETVERALVHLLTRHESLRTTYRLGPEPMQVVAGAGELTVDVCEGSGETAAFADSLAISLVATPFDLTGGLPLRVTLVTASGAPAHLVVVVSHAAADMASLALLGTEWAALLAGEPLPAPAPLQPVDLAAIERSAQGQRRTASAARHWEAQLRAGPQCMFAVPGVRGDCTEQSLLLVRSRPAAVAVAEAAARTRASRSTVVLAAMCALTSHYTAQPRCLVTSVTANRFGAELARFVGPLSSDALLAVDAAVPTFDDLVRRVHQRAMFAYARAGDVTTLASVIDRVGLDRGTWYARDCEFNDHTMFSTEGFSALPPAGPGDEVQLTWLPGQALAARLTVWLTRLDSLLEIGLWADPAALPADDAECFGAGLVRLAEAAAGQAVPMAELGALTGLRPVSRGPTWVRADTNWVDLDAVRRLVADALPGMPACVEAVPDDLLGHRVVCHIVGDITPGAAHDACMAALPGRPTAVAPHRYIVLGTPPHRGTPMVLMRQERPRTA
ncbi:MAG TPA: condensation domain-containing protein [Streptosporangiaceae bacterium]|nr:condensation domain-containing protein [Streptosporangiaceae bacterium]